MNRRTSRPKGRVVTPFAPALWLELLLAAATLATPPSTPLRLTGTAAFGPDGRTLSVEVALSCEEVPGPVEVTLEVPEGDLLTLEEPSADRIRGMAISAEEGSSFHQFNLDMALNNRLVLRIRPGAPGDHRVVVSAHSRRSEDEAWGDRYAFFYHDDGATLTEGYSLLNASTRTEAVPAPKPIRAISPPKYPETIHYPDDASSAPRGLRGTVHVTGRWMMYDPWNSYIPQDGQIVQLYDANTNALLSTSATGWDGSYSFAWVTNPGSLYVRIRCESYHNRSGGQDRLFVFSNRFSPDTSVYSADTPTFTGVPDGEYPVGTYAIPDGNAYEKAYWSLRWMQDAWDYIYSIHGNGSTYAGSIRTCWFPGSTWGPGWSYEDNILYLSDNDPSSPDMTVHECGHNIMWNAYGSAMPSPLDCPPSHSIKQKSGVMCGWWEGWADFLPLAVYNDPVFTWPGGASWINLESPTWGTSGWDPVLGVGYQVEGRVAGALWDLIDSTNEATHDFFTEPIVKIWNTVWYANNNNFCQFWDSTAAYGIKRNRDNCLHQNTITECTTCTEDPYENDDNSSQALQEGVPSTYTYEHCTDEDWQWVSAGRDWTYTWETDELGCGVYDSGGNIQDYSDTTLTLYASNGTTQLGYNDDKNFGNWPRASRLVWTSDRNDTVFMVARQYLADYGPHQSYDISLSRVCNNPSAASGLSPAAGATSCSSGPTLSWTGTGRTYDVYVDGSLKCSGTTNAWCATSGLSAGWRSWYVVSKNDCGGSASTSSQSFYVSSAPSTSSTSAADLSTCADTGVSITWAAPSWNDNGTGTRTFKIYRSDGTYVAEDLSQGTGSFTDTTGINNTNYTYAVLAQNGCGQQTWYSASASVMDRAAYAPDQKATTAGDASDCADTGVSVSWSAPDDWGDNGINTGGRGFYVTRNGGDITAKLSSGTISYTDTGGANNTTYTYAVRAVNGCDLTVTYSSQTASDKVGAPPASTASTATDLDDCVDTGVTVSWSIPSDWGDNGVNAAGRGFYVTRDGGDITSKLGSGTTYYTDTGGTNNTTYAYAVRAVNGCGLTVTFSGQNAADQVGAAPTQKTVSATDAHPCNNTGVSINWSLPDDWGDHGQGAGSRGFYVTRNGADITSKLSPATTAYNDNSGADNTAYTYAVRAVNGCSLTVTFTGQSAADMVSSAPTAMSTAAGDAHPFYDTGVNIAWSSPSNNWGDNGYNAAGRGFMVYRDAAAIIGWLSAGTLGSNDNGGANNTTYLYSVRARNGCGQETAYSGQYASDAVMSPGEAGAGVQGMRAIKGADTAIDLTYDLGGCSTDHTIYWGSASGPLAGLAWDGESCYRGTSGSASFDPGGVPAGGFVYFVIVGNNGSDEGSYGQSTGGGERDDASGLAPCDYTQGFSNPCP